MLALTGPADTQRQAASHGIRFLIEIDWLLDSSWAGKYSDQSVTVGVNSYTAYVQSWDVLNQSLDLLGKNAIDNLQITFKPDDTENFYDIYSPYYAEGKPIRFGIHFIGTGVADIIWKFYGVVNKVNEVGTGGIKFDCVSAAFKDLKKLPDIVVNEEEFFGAVETGKVIPIVYGSVKDVPGVAIGGAQRITYLYETIDAEETEIKVTIKPTSFPYSGNIMVDSEIIIFGYWRHSPTLTEPYYVLHNCTRGTNAVEHLIGTPVIGYDANHIVALAAHASKEVKCILVDGRVGFLPAPTINKNDTTTFPGHTLTTLTFSVPPYFPSRISGGEWVKKESYVYIHSDGEDCNVQEEQPDVNVNGGVLDLKYTYNSTDMRFYIKLNADAIPDPADYDEVYLCLYANAVSLTESLGDYAYQQIAVIEVLGAWDETTITWNNQPNGTATPPAGGGTYSAFAAPISSGWYEMKLQHPTKTFGGGHDLETGILVHMRVFKTNTDYITFFESEPNDPATMDEYRPYFKFVKNVWDPTINQVITPSVKGNIVTAYVDGVESVGDGTGTLLTNPVDIMEDLIETRLGLTVDVTTFASVKADLTALGAAFAFALTEQRDAAELLADLARQMRCWLYYSENDYKLKLRSPFSISSSRTIGITGAAGRLEPGIIKPLGVKEIKNDIILRYDKNYLTDGYNVAIPKVDSASQTKFGIQQMTFDAWAISSDAGSYADNLASFLLAHYAWPRELYQMVTAIANADLEPADVITPNDTKWGKTSPAEVMQVRLQPYARNRFHTIELAVLLSNIPYYWGDTDSGAFFLGDSLYFVIAGVVVGRMTNSGDFYIKGFVDTNISMGVAVEDPIYFDAVNSRIQFVDSDGDVVAEIDSGGNLRVPEYTEGQAEMDSDAGTDNTIWNDSVAVHINIGGVRVAEIDADAFKLIGLTHEEAQDYELL